MRIGDIAAYDDEQVRAFWTASREADAFERPYATTWSLLSATVALRDPRSPFAQHPLVAIRNGEVIGTSLLTLPKLDNTHAAFMNIRVRPEHRRRGIGAALLEAALRVAADHGRTTVMCEANLPLADPPALGETFLERRGFIRASTEVHRVLDLPVEGAHLDSLESKAAARKANYQVVTFGDRVPEQYLQGYCLLESAFNDEAPLGDLDLEPEVWDEDRVRDNEARYAEQGRGRRAAIALSGDGEVVALTEMITAETHAWQSGTLVLPAHRGHRLGMATKIANLRAFQAEFPAITMLHSWNAEENGPMAAINVAMGFRPVEYVVEMQKVL